MTKREKILYLLDSLIALAEITPSDQNIEFRVGEITKDGLSALEASKILSLIFKKYHIFTIPEPSFGFGTGILPIIIPNLATELRLKAIRSDIYPTIDTDARDKSNRISKLEYYQEDGIAIFKGVDWRFKGKAMALLNFFNENRNTPFNIEDIRRYCNPHIKNQRYKFRAMKDINDSILAIRKRLKVSSSEYFPLKKHGDTTWIWEER